METLENLIKVSEENKMNFENNDKNKALNENMNNEIAKNNEEEKPSNNFNLDNLLNNKISMNNIPEEKEKENEKFENNIKEEKNENNFNSEYSPLSNKQKTINDIITENNKNNNINIEYEYKDKEENEEYIGRDRTYSFRPKKSPGTPVLNKKEEKNVSEFKIENDQKETEVKETNQIFNSIPAFTETIQTKIENKENVYMTVNDQITNKQNNNNNNDESGDDSAYREEEDFLAQEELKRSQKEEINNVYNKEEKKEDKDVDIIEERKEEEEDDNNEIKAKEKEEEEAQKKYLEEQDKRKSLQNLRNEMDMRTSSLRDSVEQKKKQLIEMLNKKKKLAESQKEKEKEKDKLNKIKINEIIINEKKEKEFNNNTIKSAKKKQNSNTVFNRLYNNDRKKEKEKERQREREREREKEKEKELEAYKKTVIRINNTNKNNKSNKSYQNILSTKKKEKEINSIIIDENINDENNLLNNSQGQNIQFPMINDLKKDLSKNAPQKQNTSQNLFDTNEFIKKFLNESKNMKNAKKFEQFAKPIMFDDSVNDSFSFRPEINRRSKILCNKRLKNTKNTSPNSKNTKNEKNVKNLKKDVKNAKNTKIIKNTKSYVENRRLNASVNELLYEDASFKKQRLENICINEEINFKKSGNQPLISKGSANLLLKNYEVKLNNTIEK